MWRRLTFVIPSVVLLVLGAAATEVTDLVHHAQAHERAVHAREARRLADTTAALRLRALALQQATEQRDQAEAQLAQVSADRDALQAKADDLQAQVDNLKTRIAYSSAVIGLGGGGSPTSAAPAFFPYGWCTYYVATRRLVTWSGNAIDWWWNAQGIRPEGQAPQPGAIMVSRESGYGHVAYVESVTSPSVFTVSEMNYTAWGFVDIRVVNRAVVPVVGFIY